MGSAEKVFRSRLTSGLVMWVWNVSFQNDGMPRATFVVMKRAAIFAWGCSSRMTRAVGSASRQYSRVCSGATVHSFQISK